MDRARFWAMVDAARTASTDHLSRQLELAAARRDDLPPQQLVGYRRMELLAAQLGDLPLPEVVGDRWMQQPVEGRLGDLDLLLTEVISVRQVELLAARLGDLPLSEVVDFHRVVEELEADSFRVDLWSAALVIHRMGPVDDFWCSEDTLFGFGSGWSSRAGWSTRRPSPTPTRWPTTRSWTTAFPGERAPGGWP